jgi:polyhydroxybutyrate depolymerase
VRSPGLAIAWEFRQRHRPALVALASYALAFVAVRLLILGPGQPLTLDPPNGIAAAVIVPLSTAFMYFLAVFSFGLGGEMAARQSPFPARMFTLPVTTRALAGWPMLFGTAAVASLWLITAPFVRWSWGLDLPLIWPALLGAVFLAWTQVLTWTAYGLPGLRVVVAVLWLMVLDAAVILAVQLKVPEPRLVAMLAPQLPLAYLAACFVLARARRGDVPDWRGVFARVARIAHALPRGQARFSSPMRAQAWFEWRQHGWVLPAMVGILLPFELALLYLASDEPPVLVFCTLLGVLLTPPFLAGFIAATAGERGRDGSDSSGVTLTATRPLTSAALVAAKLRIAAWSTLVTWLLVLVATPIALALSGTWPLVVERVSQGVEAVGKPRAIVIALLGLSGLLASTWKQHVQSLCIALTGRARIVRASVLLRLSLLIVIGPLLQWIHDDGDVQAALWQGWPWVLAVLACLKLSAALWVAARLHRGRLLSDRSLVTGAASWLAVVLALYGVLVWLVSTPFIPGYLPALVAILAVPLARLSAAPLALAWSRHRGARGHGDPESGTVAKASPMVVRTVSVLLGVPLALALVEAVHYEVRNRSNGTIVSSGQEREYLLHVPRSYDRARPTPLVISMHGGAGWPAMQKETSRWNRLAESHGFIVVYPSGISGRGPRAWHMSPSGLARDVRFISDLIDSLTAAYNIDGARVYADGLSNGGGMAFVLSCRLADRIAAVGMVASAQLLPFDWCKEQRAVPMIAFHGTADRTTPYHGGTSWVVPVVPLPDIPTWAASWARRNRCRPDPVESAAAADVSRLEYTDCADDAAVVLYTVKGGGHSWPGGGPLPEWLVGATSHGIDATSLMWSFFRQHRLVRGGREPGPTGDAGRERANQARRPGPATSR